MCTLSTSPAASFGRSQVFPRRQKGHYYENHRGNREHHQPDTIERRRNEQTDSSRGTDGKGSKNHRREGTDLKLQLKW